MDYQWNQGGNLKKKPVDKQQQWKHNNLKPMGCNNVVLEGERSL